MVFITYSFFLLRHHFMATTHHQGSLELDQVHRNSWLALVPYGHDVSAYVVHIQDWPPTAPSDARQVGPLARRFARERVAVDIACAY